MINSSNIEVNDKLIVNLGGPHGFTITNNIPLPATIDSVSGNIILADGSDAAKQKTFFISKILGPNTLLLRGDFHNSPAHGLNIGEWYFVSDTVPGEYVQVAPTPSNDVAIFVFDADNLILLEKRRV